MENAIYKCLSSDFPKVEQKIKRITKKLDKKNLNYTFNVIGEHPEEVTVLDYSLQGSIPAWQFQPAKSSTIADITSYIFIMDDLKIGSYDVLAVIEHASTIENKQLNLIHIIKENAVIPEKYRTISSNCEHCNHNRPRNKTVLLQSDNGNIIQVGSTCLQEYTGIDCIDVIGHYTDIRSICINEPFIDHSELSRYDNRYTKTIDFLASCIYQITKDGYQKDVTKNEAWKSVRKNDYLKHLDTAKVIIEYFKNNDYVDNFLSNIKIAVTSEYSKCNGFIAYAYVAYQKEIEKDKLKEVEQISEYYGKVGDKIQLELYYKSRFTFETMYGMQSIYLFVDQNGNAFKWKTSGTIFKIEDEENYIYVPYDEGDKLTLKCTIKDHTVYDGVKQTELIRCKKM